MEELYFQAEGFGGERIDKFLSLQMEDRARS